VNKKHAHTYAIMGLKKQFRPKQFYQHLKMTIFHSEIAINKMWHAQTACHGL